MRFSEVKRARSNNTYEEKVEDILGSFIGQRQALSSVQLDIGEDETTYILRISFNDEAKAAKVYGELEALESDDKVRASSVARVIFDKFEYEDAEISGDLIELSDVEIVGGRSYVAKPEKAQGNAARRKKESALSSLEDELRKIWPELDSNDLDLQIGKQGYVFMIYNAEELADSVDKVEAIGAKILRSVYKGEVDASTVDAGVIGYGSTVYVQVPHAF